MNFFQHHPNNPYILLFALACFPRLTLLIASFASGGVLWWLGWFLAPHFLVAILATISYSSTNPFLVAVAWLFALSGTGAESAAVKRGRR